MRIHQRALSGQIDLRAMEALAGEFRAENLHVNDLPYRLNTSALDDPENVRLWFDETGRLLAWIILQVPFCSLDFAIRPEVEADLLPQLLAWVDERSRAHPEIVPLGTPENGPCWFVNIFADRASTLRILEAAGFASQADVGEYSWSKVWLMRPADLPVKEFRIPEGFIVRPLGGDGEVEACVELHRATFGSRIMNVGWRRRTLRHPDYVPDLDLVVTAPDGRLAAFCICWLNSHGPEPTGQIEPLGCHPDFRHYALGRIALVEGLRRLKAHGAVKIFVETDSWRSTAKSLYESLGFQVVRDVLVYRKDY